VRARRVARGRVPAEPAGAGRAVSHTPRAIAIVGLGGFFPGAPTPEHLWELVSRGESAAAEPPAGRWALPVERAHEPGGRVTPDAVLSRKACFVEEPPLSLEGLAIDETLARALDPLHRLALHAAQEALRSCATSTVDRSRTGVILGSIALPTETSSALAWETIGEAFLATLPSRDARPAPRRRATTHDANRSVTGLPARVIAQALGLGGPAFTLDAACASSLFAVKLACDELREGRLDAVLTGGLARPDSLYTQMGFSALSALSPSGRCAPFDRSGDGLVTGEGAGIFLLKRLEDALRDGDRVLAVIRGIGLSNDVDGKLLAPSSEGQLRAMRAAYAEAGWAPGDVELVECHATGTPKGDAVEVASLAALRAEGGLAPCVIGSVKSNVGHLLTGAGAAALAKVLLALRHEALPPTAHFAEAAPGLGLEGAALEVLRAPRPWARHASGRPRRAAVSGFGFGGVNAHLLLEEWAPVAVTVTPSTLLSPREEPVAIVGMAARIGPWETLARFERHVLGAGPEVAPTARPSPGAPHGASLRGHFLVDVQVPPTRFRIPPRELQEMLPQQLVLLDVAKSALEDATGGAITALGNDAGVFVGLGLDAATMQYHLRWTALAQGKSWARERGLDPTAPEVAAWLRALPDTLAPSLNADRTMGALGGLAASRVARELGVGGPCFVLSSEGTSGLTALEAAVGALRRGELSKALVGAVEITGSGLSVSEADARGVVGEGAVALVLKRLSDTERDGDHIHSVIRDVGAAVRLPSTEVTSRAVACDATRDVGFAGAVSGLASVAKAALALSSRMAPTSDGAPRAPRPWLHDRAHGPRRALVGDRARAGASTPCVLLEEHASVNARSSISARALHASPPRGLVPRDEGILLVRAPDAAGIARGLAALEADLSRETPEAGIDAFAGRAWRAARDQRMDGARAPGLTLALVARSITEAARLASAARAQIESATGDANDLGSALQTASGGRAFFSASPLAPTGDIAFVYPGSGNHFPGMGREHAALFPDVLRAHEARTAHLAGQIVPEVAWDADQDAMHARPDALILSQVALGALLTDIVRGFAVAPRAAIGYSLGESTSLVALGAWPDRDDLHARVRASTLFTEEMAGPCRAAARAWGLPEGTQADWLMAVVERPAERVRAEIAGRARVYLLIVNTREECVIGGERAAVLEYAREAGITLRPLPGVTAVHCEVARPVEAEYRALHLLETKAPAGVRFYGGAKAQAYEVTRESAAEAIVAQALHGIDFPATIEAAYADGARIFVEAGVGNSCTRMVDRILAGRPHVARPVCVRGQSALGTVLRLLASLAAEGVAIDLAPLYGDPAPEERSPAKAERAIRFPIARAAFGTPPAMPAPRAAPSTSAPTFDRAPLVSQLALAHAGRSSAQEAFLRLSATSAATMASAIGFRMSLLERGGATALVEDLAEPIARPAVQARPASPDVASPAVFLDRAGCLEFATGSIARALGPRFAAIDAFPTRVRLPDEPLMLCDRVMSVDAEPLSMRPGSLVTEHDVAPGRWYLDHGRIPTGVAVESGQADLFLSGYLGIDLETRGLATYRLLDAVVTFHDALPRVGDVIRYAISIKELFRHGGSWFFRFQFDATVAGRPLMTMREGLAGFFSEAELAAGKGVVRSRLDVEASAGLRSTDVAPLAPRTTTHESLDARALECLYLGDLAGAFGPAFARLPLARPATLPGGLLRLLERVPRLETAGGRHGLGVVEAEMDIRPDAWFLTCHFVDDRVMPGTLMYECCMHALRILALRQGWIGEEGRVAFEPVPGVASRLKCRGQVTGASRVVRYEIHVKELRYGPAPEAIADALIHADGKTIVEITDMSLRISGLDRPSVEALWSAREAVVAAPPVSSARTPRGPRPALYDRSRIEAFAQGKPSVAFGAPYTIFDEGRKIARLPRDPFQLMDRVISVTGEPFRFVAGGVVEAEVDLATTAWTFAANRQEEISFAVLLEIALQPCGWLAGYVGSALTSETDLRFRNLGGKATLRRPVTRAAAILSTRIRMTSLSQSGDSIIQRYDFAVSDDEGVVYEGDTYFGFFTKAALADQKGVRGARLHEPTAGQAARARSFAFPEGAPFPEERLRMMDRVERLIEGGGAAGLGFVEGTKRVRPLEWFFEAHFFEDPVWPGSLGLEAFLQLVKVFAHERWRGGAGAGFSTVAPGTTHAWTYRGQVIPADRLVTVQVEVTAVDDARRRVTAKGRLSVDGRVIYEMADFALDYDPDAATGGVS